MSPLNAIPDPIVMVIASQSHQLCVAGRAGMSCATSMVSTSWMRPMWRRMALSPPSQRRMHTLPAGLSGMMPLWTEACAWYSTIQPPRPPAWALLFIDILIISAYTSVCRNGFWTWGDVQNTDAVCEHCKMGCPTSCSPVVALCPSSRSSLLWKAEQLLYARTG